MKDIKIVHRDVNISFDTKYVVDLRFWSRYVKVRFFLESIDVFVITPNRRTFFFPETENLNFGD